MNNINIFLIAFISIANTIRKIIFPVLLLTIYIFIIRRYHPGDGRSKNDKEYHLPQEAPLPRMASLPRTDPLTSGAPIHSRVPIPSDDFWNGDDNDVPPPLSQAEIRARGIKLIYFHIISNYNKVFKCMIFFNIMYMVYTLIYNHR
jgi:hypothetical protein